MTEGHKPRCPEASYHTELPAGGKRRRQRTSVTGEGRGQCSTHSLITCDIRPFPWAEPKLGCPPRKAGTPRRRTGAQALCLQMLGGSPKPELEMRPVPDSGSLKKTFVFGCTTSAQMILAQSRCSKNKLLND